MQMRGKCKEQKTGWAPLYQTTTLKHLSGQGENPRESPARDLGLQELLFSLQSPSPVSKRVAHTSHSENLECCSGTTALQRYRFKSFHVGACCKSFLDLDS